MPCISLQHVHSAILALCIEYKLCLFISHSWNGVYLIQLDRSLRSVCLCVLYVSVVVKHVGVVNKQALFYIKSVLEWCVCCMINKFLTDNLGIVLHPTYYNHIILESDSLCFFRWQNKWTKSGNTNSTISVKKSVTHCCQKPIHLAYIVFSFRNLIVRL